MDRAGAAGARRRNRVQRSAGKPALSRRAGAAIRARQALSRRQAGERSGHHGYRSAALRGARRGSMKTLAAWLEFIDRQHPKAIALGLDRVAEVAARMKVALRCPVITVAGTNGKGSTCAMLE